MSYTKKQQAAGLIGWFLVCFVAAATGGTASIQAGTFYTQELARPDWAPPASVFGPVWTTLYALMAISAWLVWRAAGFGANRRALSLFLCQLAVNALWSWLFFAWLWCAPIWTRRSDVL